MQSRRENERTVPIHRNRSSFWTKVGFVAGGAVAVVTGGIGAPIVAALGALTLAGGGVVADHLVDQVHDQQEERDLSLEH